MIFRALLFSLCVVVITQSLFAEDVPTVKIGSKGFTEGVVLGEVLTQMARFAGVDTEHRKDLGGTPVLWNALKRGDIDAYVEYTGTLHQELFAGRNFRDDAELRKVLKDEFQIGMSQPLGLNNSYKLGMKKSIKESQRGITPEAWQSIRTISDLRKFPQLKMGFSNEFTERADGWPALKQEYRLPQTDVRGLEHELAYRGLESGAIDLIDIYATDAEVAYYDLKLLKDDLKFFPDYHAVILYREDLKTESPAALDAILRLVGRIDDETVIPLNAQSKIEKRPVELIARDYLKEEFGIESNVEVQTFWQRLAQTTREHLFLVGISIVAAIIVAVPGGIFAAKFPRAGQILVGITNIFQTIPSLVLFVLFIPFLGLNERPAICALFLYSLLPIVRNTVTGLQSIEPSIHESALALGMPAWSRLWKIELPLASRSILAGIKIAAVINVGTATLGGLIGAGGYGSPIFAGIRKDSVPLMLEGAIPAAVLALLVQGGFELSERWIVPRGLRLANDA